MGVRLSRKLCVDEEYAEGEAGAHSTTPTYTTGKDSPAREPSFAETIHPACMCEGGGRGGEKGGRAFYYTYIYRSHLLQAVRVWSKTVCVYYCKLC